MRIALIGYGKMGKLIDELILKTEHQVVSRIDPHLPNSKIDKHNLNDADVCIDFSSPAHVIDNIKKLAELNQNIVVGTTGWYDQLEHVKETIIKQNSALIYASNFSIGVNIFLKIVDEAASLINHFQEYDASGFEIHHNQKLDSPSGTAKSITSTLLKRLDRKKKVIYEKIDRKIEPEELHFASLRIGLNPGEHHVIYDSSEDTISISHVARNREGFAKGAIYAAEWLNGKKGFYTVNDLMEDNFYA